MNPDELLALVRRIRQKNVAEDVAQIPALLQENGYASLAALEVAAARARMTAGAKREAEALTMGRLAQAAVRGATLGAVTPDDYDLFHRANPGAAMAGEIAGSMIPNVLGGIGTEAVLARTMAPTMARTALAGGLTGAATTGAQAAITAPDGQRAGKAGVGAMLGFGAGAAGPAAFRLGAGALSPNVRATQRARLALSQPGEADAARAALADAQAAGRLDQTVVADLTPGLQQELDFAANTNPSVRARVVRELRPRRVDRPARLIDDVTDEIGPVPTVQAAQDAADERVRAVGRQTFNVLREQNPTVQVDDALRGILSSGEQMQRLLGRELRPLYSGGPKPISFATLQSIKDRLDDEAAAAFNPMAPKGNLGREIADARDRLVGWMEDNVPGYREANAAYRAAADERRALTSGIEAWNKASPRDLERLATTMPPAQLAMLRQGLAAKLIESLEGAKPSSAGAVTDLIETTLAKNKKLEILFGGREQFRNFLRKAEVEQRMRQSEDVVGNSLTAFRGANAEMNPADMMDAGISGGIVKGARALIGRGMTQRTARGAGNLMLSRGAAVPQVLDRLLTPNRFVAPGVTGGVTSSLVYNLLLGNK